MPKQTKDEVVKVYGAGWCPLTRRALLHLKDLQVPFEYIDVEADPAGSQWVKEQNEGKELKPTIDVGGTILAEPTNAEIDAALGL